MGFGADVAPEGAVVGWWKFDDAANPGKDSSEYGNDLSELNNASYVAKDTGYTNRGYYNDSGCLEVTSAGGVLWCSSKSLGRVRRLYIFGAYSDSDVCR